MNKQFTHKVACYDCGEEVWDLKLHRNMCPKSRKNKSLVTNAMEPKSQLAKEAEDKRENEIDIFFLLDVSGSMDGYKLSESKRVLSDIVNKLDGHDRFSIITFDTDAYLKLKPHPVRKVKREIPETLNRIFAKGGTAMYDAIHLVYDQIKDKSKKSVIIVLTDGEDNSSKKTLQSVFARASEYTNISLNILYISSDNNHLQIYKELCEKIKGRYDTTNEKEIYDKFLKFSIEVIIKIKTNN
ncbi:MAG: RING zinc finger-containing protein [Satyrvirus sp.]|uniref:RING zinc finger-containing protein n=1 Tax=Satyrvirus sp. TaxID=2487771 RepID=A0A3G5AFR6_9VIRU|nr:MAG: RING zinc finger-containing protein [Satyrvirus sp.]